MSILTTRCPHCSQTLQIPDNALGKPIQCPICKQLFAVQPAKARELEPAVCTLAPPTSNFELRTSTADSRQSKANPKTEVRKLKLEVRSSSCPACQSKIAFGLMACPECGLVVHDEGAGLETETIQNICPNKACGVANPAGERICQRCSYPLPIPPGSLLHQRYRIEDLLAIGGFAAVYRAADLKGHNARVAIKDMICPAPEEHDIRLSFFQREADILRALAGQPIVPRIYDFICTSHSAQIVMEFIPGQDLLQALQRRGNKPFPLEMVIEWGKSLCDVLGHMHRMSPPLIHRDVKPENIMLLEDQRSIRMIDFGTARDVEHAQKARLAAKTRVYTEGYAPPEQVVGKPEARSDLFALAGTLYHLATGRAPEGHYTAHEIASQLALGNGAIAPGQRWFFELIQNNLAEDVSDRYFTCQEFKRDLEHRQITRILYCPKCKAENPVRQPYCGKCATPITDPAPPCQHCGKVNRLGTRFCIQCGHRFR
jgi:predicted Ser/Thr protein kinase